MFNIVTTKQWISVREYPTTVISLVDVIKCSTCTYIPGLEYLDGGAVNQGSEFPA